MTEEFQYVLEARIKNSKYPFINHNQIYQQLDDFLEKQHDRIDREAKKYILDFILTQYADQNYHLVYSINKQLNNGKVKIICHKDNTMFIQIPESDDVIVECVSCTIDCLQYSSESIRLISNDINQIMVSDYITKFEVNEDISTFNFIPELVFESYTNLISLKIPNRSPDIIFCFYGRNQDTKVIDLSQYTNLKILQLGDIQHDIILPSQLLLTLYLSQSYNLQWKILNKYIDSNSIYLKNFKLRNVVYKKQQQLKLVGCTHIFPKNHAQFYTPLKKLYIDNVSMNETLLNFDLTIYQDLTDVTLKYLNFDQLITNNLDPVIYNCRMNYLITTQLQYISQTYIKFYQPNQHQKTIILEQNSILRVILTDQDNKISEIEVAGLALICFNDQNSNKPLATRLDFSKLQFLTEICLYDTANKHIIFGQTNESIGVFNTNQANLILIDTSACQKLKRSRFENCTVRKFIMSSVMVNLTNCNMKFIDLTKTNLLKDETFKFCKQYKTCCKYVVNARNRQIYKMPENHLEGIEKHNNSVILALKLDSIYAKINKVLNE